MWEAWHCVCDLNHIPSSGWFPNGLTGDARKKADTCDGGLP
jgi:hypothetical protein